MVAPCRSRFHAHEPQAAVRNRPGRVRGGGHVVAAPAGPGSAEPSVSAQAMFDTGPQGSRPPGPPSRGTL
ncbi:hypothetical protein CRI70_04710 [Streptomyces sp. Ru87]|nr:hypothetical protein CRI70_04710 [Streptomyces sp. Ru87]